MGNMKQQVLRQGEESTKLSMAYNRGNQLISKTSPEGKIAYKYDPNGNLVSKTLGKQTDTYTYDALDRLVGYSGYDGFEQQYTVDMNGLRTSMQQKGNTERYTLEDLLKGEVFRPELPEANIPTNQAAADALEPTAGDWEKTSYIYDITLPYGQMLTETTGGSTTVYTYGLERMGAVDSGGVKTQYVYDGRGSVAQTVTSLPGIEPPTVQSFAYTPFGEILGGKQSGFGYNGEYYDAATGMLNLRARQYEPAMNRFSQKDQLRGRAVTPISLNRYGFVWNNPIGMTDPTGKQPIVIDYTEVDTEMTQKQMHELNKEYREENTPKGEKVSETKQPAIVHFPDNEGKIIGSMDVQLRPIGEFYHIDAFFVPDTEEKKSFTDAKNVFVDVLQERATDKSKNYKYTEKGLVVGKEDTVFGYPKEPYSKYMTVPAILEFTTADGRNIKTACMVRIFPHRGDGSGGVKTGSGAHFDIYLPSSTSQDKDPKIVEATNHTINMQKAAASAVKFIINLAIQLQKK